MTNVPVNSSAFVVPDNFTEQLNAMLALQDEANLVLFPDWSQRRLAWHRAIYVEAAELIEQLGCWKWWKKGKPDMAQAQLELGDLWHFGLSWCIERFGQPIGSEALATAITRRVRQGVEMASRDAAAGLSEAERAELRNVLIDRMIEQAGGRLFGVENFVRLMLACDLDFDGLFRVYIAKNALNRFRWTHGYREGTYVKMWQGVEDNVHLEHELDAAMRQGVAPAQLLQHVLQRVETLYNELALPSAAQEVT